LTLDEREVIDIIPSWPELLVSEGESIKLDQPLTSNRNVGGFGQRDAEIVLQDLLRGTIYLYSEINTLFWEFQIKVTLRKFAKLHLLPLI